MRILITGANGFVGGALLRGLRGLRGHDLVGLTRAEQDLSAPDAAERLAERLAPCDVIIHCAAKIDMRPFEPTVISGNALATQQVLALAERWDAYVVNFSSIQVIGAPVTLPITEAHPTAPLTVYHAAKLFGEQLLALSGVRGVSLRLTAPVGADMPLNRILPVFVTRARMGEPLTLAGAGGREQDYITTDDICAAVAGCLKQQPTGVMNLGSGMPLSNRALAQTCIEVLESSSQILVAGGPDPQEDARWHVSIARARAEIGYAPTHDLPGVIRALADRMRP